MVANTWKPKYFSGFVKMVQSEPCPVNQTLFLLHSDHSLPVADEKWNESIDPVLAPTSIPLAMGLA